MEILTDELQDKIAQVEMNLAQAEMRFENATKMVLESESAVLLFREVLDNLKNILGNTL